MIFIGDTLTITNHKITYYVYHLSKDFYTRDVYNFDVLWNCDVEKCIKTWDYPLYKNYINESIFINREVG